MCVFQYIIDNLLCFLSFFWSFISATACSGLWAASFYALVGRQVSSSLTFVSSYCYKLETVDWLIDMSLLARCLTFSAYASYMLQYRQIQNVTIKLSLQNWSSSQLTHNVLRTVLVDLLGYNVEMSDISTWANVIEWAGYMCMYFFFLIN